MGRQTIAAAAACLAATLLPRGAHADESVHVAASGDGFTTSVDFTNQKRYVRDPLPYCAFEQDYNAFKQRDPNNGSILPWGRVLEFASDVLPRAIAVCPYRKTVVTLDGKPHGNLNAGKFLSFLHAKRPYPWGYMVSPSGELLRKMDWADRQVLPYGVTEARDGRIAITFYTAVQPSEARLEVWDTSLDTKLTFHDYSLRAAIPTFDRDGLLWVPYTILDRLNEEYPTIVGMWVYKRDGSRWEVFPRRQFVNVRFPHTVSIDNAGRIYMAGLVGKWPYIDGTYGLEPRPGLETHKAQARIDIYTLARDPGHSEYVQEQIERWREMNGGWDKAPQPTPAQYEGVRPLAALKLHRSFAFPFFCVQTLFALTGDGHVLASCHGESTLAVMRIGRPGRTWANSIASEAGRAIVKGSTEEVLKGAWTAAPTYASLGPAYASTLSESSRGSVEGAEADWYDLPGLEEEVVLDLDESDGPDAGAEAKVVAKIHRPFGINSIGGIVMDPTGTAFTLLDMAGRRVVTSPWPLLQDPTATEGKHYTLPKANTKNVRVTW